MNPQEIILQLISFFQSANSKYDTKKSNNIPDDRAREEAAGETLAENGFQYVVEQGIIRILGAPVGTVLTMLQVLQILINQFESGKNVNFTNINNKNYIVFEGDNFDNILAGTVLEDYITGLGGNDNLFGDIGNDVIYGGLGNDNIYGQIDNDEIYGGGNNDYIEGGSGTDTIHGNEGNDTLYGAGVVDIGCDDGSNNYLYGDSGNDSLIGGTGNDYLDGGSDGDTLMGGYGNDTYVFDNNSNYNNDVVKEYSGEGSVDTLDFSSMTTGVNINLSNGGGFAVGSDLSGIEKIIGGSGSDSLTGTSLNDTIYGNNGNDIINSLGGNDIIYGGDGVDSIDSSSGDDKLIGGGGNDTLQGGSGNDLYIIKNTDGNDLIIDSDKSGGILYEDMFLAGGKNVENTQTYQDYFGNVYIWDGINGSNLVINDKITVQNFNNGDLNIYLRTQDFPPQKDADGMIIPPIYLPLNDCWGKIVPPDVPIYFDDKNVHGVILQNGKTVYDPDSSKANVFVEKNDKTVIKNLTNNSKNALNNKFGYNVNNNDVRIKIPQSIVKPVDYSPLMEVANQSYNGEPPIDNTKVGLIDPDSTNSSIIYKYTSKPSGGGFWGPVFFFVGAALGSILGGIGAILGTGASIATSGLDTTLVVTGQIVGASNPLSLDLDGDGIETIDIKTNNISFDTNNDSFKERSGWLKGDDGLLVRDLDENGLIEHQNELFGSYSTTGFGDLSLLDSNADSIINSTDTQFSTLKVWQDINENGLTDSNELKTLAEVGIQSINLTTTDIDENQYNNIISAKSSFTKTNGTQGDVYDVRFAAAPLYTTYSGTYEIDGDIINLPWIRGYGKVVDLQLAASQNDSLKTLIGQLAGITDSIDLYGSMDELLVKWTSSDNIPSDAMSGSVNSRKLAIVCKFLNFDIPTSISDSEKVYIEESYKAIKDKLYVDFLSQTSIGGNFEITYDYTTDAILFNDNLYSKLIENLTNADNFHASYQIAKYLAQAKAIDLTKLSAAVVENGYGTAIFRYLNNGFKVNDVGQHTITEAYTPYYIPGTEGTDVLTGNAQVDVIYGRDGNDIISGTGSDDFLSGDNGNDILNGDQGNDTLNGGQGNDTLNGGQGNDTYIFEGNFGHDTLKDEYWVKVAYQKWHHEGWWIFGKWKSEWVTETINQDGGKDTIVFGKDVTPDDLRFNRNGYNLVIEQINTNNKITIKNWYVSNNYKVEKFVFDNGLVLSKDHIQNAFYGSSNADSVNADAYSNFIHTNEGNDTINAHAGNDLIESGAGDDLITGGTGNDQYHDPYGNDTYNFNLGDGQDNIIDTNGYDTINFGTEITQNSLTFSRKYKDLVVSINNTSDKIIINDYFVSDTNKIEEYRFIDNTFLTKDNVEQLITSISGSEYNDNLYGTTTNNTISGYNGDDYIDGRSGDDIIYGGAGNDILKGVDGSDTLYGDQGNDSLYGGDGNDLIEGGDGDDRIDGWTGIDTMVGGLGNDIYVVDNANDLINNEYSNGGIDRVESYITYTLGNNLEILKLVGTSDINGYGNSLNNILGGNSANNILNGNGGNDYIYGKEGNDSIDGGSGNDTIYGDQGNDTLCGGIDNDLIYSSDGDDRINGWTGIDTMIGGLGNDYYIVDDSSDVVTENTDEGSDTVESSITYTLGNNLEILKLVGTSDINGAGNELANTIGGNSANNTIYGYAGNDYIYGKEGNDSIDSGSENDTVYGDAGNDTIYGGGGNDLICGGAGDDKLAGWTDIDTMIGGLGNDYYIVDNSCDVVTENTDEGSDTVESSITYTLGNNLEILKLVGTADINGTGNELANTIGGNSANNTIYGYTGNDYIYGKEGNDSIDGGSDNDTVYGDAGNDTIYGGGGNDLICGGAGDDKLAGWTDIDTMIGGLGNDYYIVDNSCDVVTENIDEGSDTVESSITYTLGNNLEILKLVGTSAINGTGNELANTIGGNSANNTIYGYAGNDYIYGKEGNDSIDGGSGNDTVYGDAGNDTIYGCGGNDLICGGAGDDTYTFNLGDNSDTISESTGTDTVKFSTNVLEQNIALFMDGSNNLIFDYGSSVGNDVVTIQNQQTNTVERVELNNGEYLTNTDINQIIQNITAFASNNNIQLTSVNDVRNNQDLMNIVAAGWHS